MSLRDSFKFEAPSAKQEEMEASRLRISDGGLKEAGRDGVRAEQSQFGVKTCKTNPIPPRRRGLTEGIVQNEAKLGETGVYGQRQLSCAAWLGRGACDCGLQIAD